MTVDSSDVPRSVNVRVRLVAIKHKALFIVTLGDVENSLPAEIQPAIQRSQVGKCHATYLVPGQLRWALHQIEAATRGALWTAIVRRTPVLWEIHYGGKREEHLPPQGVRDVHSAVAPLQGSWTRLATVTEDD